jgi:hypothetical protein
LAGAHAPASAQTAPPSRAPVFVTLDLSTSEMRRNVGLMTAAGQALNRGADLALDRLFARPEGKGWKRIAGRVAALYLVNLPITAFTHTMAHEVGHIARMHEAGLSVGEFRMTLPWPAPISFATIRTEGLLNGSELFPLGIIGAGEEGANVRTDAIVDGIYRRDRANYFDWTLLVYAKLDMPLYAWTNLRSSDLRSVESFFESRTGDPKAYASDLARARCVQRMTGSSSLPSGSQLEFPECPSLADLQGPPAICVAARGSNSPTTRSGPA